MEKFIAEDWSKQRLLRAACQYENRQVAIPNKIFMEGIGKIFVLPGPKRITPFLAVAVVLTMMLMIVLYIIFTQPLRSGRI